MYIRTKDGIYEVEQSQLEDDEEVVNCDYGQIHKLEILRKSENLDELCDEFVFYAKGFIKPQVYDKLQKKKIAVMKQMVNSTIEDVKLYYAIWTSKGLIYVAKMNESGVLELI